MNVFPGLDPADPVPYLHEYITFLADQASTLLVIAIARARYYHDRYFALNQAAWEAAQHQQRREFKQLLGEAATAWDQAAGYVEEAHLFLWDHRQ